MMELKTMLRFGLVMVVGGALMITCDKSSTDGGNGTGIDLASLSTPASNTAVVVLSDDIDEDNATGEEAVYTISSNWTDLTKGEIVFDNPAGNGNGSVEFKFSDVTTAGTVTTNGTTIDFEWHSPGGQIFFVDETCDLTITSPYTGDSGTSFTGQTECVVLSGGYTFTVYVKFDKTEP